MLSAVSGAAIWLLEDDGIDLINTRSMPFISARARWLAHISRQWAVFPFAGCRGIALGAREISALPVEHNRGAEAAGIASIFISKNIHLTKW